MLLISTVLPVIFGCEKGAKEPASDVFFIDEPNGVIVYDKVPFKMPDKYPAIKEIEMESYRKPSDRSSLDNMPLIKVDPNAFPMITIPFDPNLYPMKILK